MSRDRGIEHVCMAWRIRPERRAEYLERHATMWPELEARLRELGLVDCTIFRRGDECFGHFQVRGGWEAHLAAYEADPLGQRWEREFGELIEIDDPPELLDHVWSLGDREES
jgi:L-rhamnose mutarotase